jgi:hypothetical protein
MWIEWERRIERDRDRNAYQKNIVKGFLGWVLSVETDDDWHLK